MARRIQWTPSEDEALLASVLEVRDSGGLDWSKISSLAREKLPSFRRMPELCKYHWHQSLNPELDHNPAAPSELRQLVLLRALLAPTLSAPVAHITRLLCMPGALRSALWVHAALKCKFAKALDVDSLVRCARETPPAVGVQRDAFKLFARALLKKALAAHTTAEAAAAAAAVTPPPPFCQADHLPAIRQAWRDGSKAELRIQCVRQWRTWRLDLAICEALLLPAQPAPTPPPLPLSPPEHAPLEREEPWCQARTEGGAYQCNHNMEPAPEGMADCQIVGAEAGEAARPEQGDDGGGAIAAAASSGGGVLDEMDEVDKVQ